MSSTRIVSVKIIRIKTSYYIVAKHKDGRMFTYGQSTSSLESAKKAATQVQNALKINRKFWVLGNVADFRF